MTTENKPTYNYRSKHLSKINIPVEFAVRTTPLAGGMAELIGIVSQWLGEHPADFYPFGNSSHYLTLAEGLILMAMEPSYLQAYAESRYAYDHEAHANEDELPMQTGTVPSFSVARVSGSDEVIMGSKTLDEAIQKWVLPNKTVFAAIHCNFDTVVPQLLKKYKPAFHSLVLGTEAHNSSTQNGFSVKEQGLFCAWLSEICKYGSKENLDRLIASVGNITKTLVNSLAAHYTIGMTSSGDLKVTPADGVSPTLWMTQEALDDPTSSFSWGLLFIEALESYTDINNSEVLV